MAQCEAAEVRRKAPAHIVPHSTRRTPWPMWRWSGYKPLRTSGSVSTHPPHVRTCIALPLPHKGHPEAHGTPEASTDAAPCAAIACSPSPFPMVVVPSILHRGPGLPPHPHTHHSPMTATHQPKSRAHADGDPHDTHAPVAVALAAERPTPMDRASAPAVALRLCVGGPEDLGCEGTAGRVAPSIVIARDVTPIVSSEGEGALMCETRSSPRTSSTAAAPTARRRGPASRRGTVRRGHSGARATPGSNIIGCCRPTPQDIGDDLKADRPEEACAFWAAKPSSPTPCSGTRAACTKYGG